MIQPTYQLDALYVILVALGSNDDDARKCGVWGKGCINSYNKI